MPDQDGIELRWILGVTRRWWWLIIGCTLLVAAVTYAVLSSMPPVYAAKAVLLIEPAQDSNNNEYSVLIAGERLALTYSQLLKERSILEAVIAQLDLNDTPDSLVKRVTAAPVNSTQLIRLTVKDSSPSQAALIANTIAETFVARNQKLQDERYAYSLASIQDKLGALSSQVENTQSEIDRQTTQKIEHEAELIQLNSLLSEYRSDYRALQQSYQALELGMAQIKDRVKIIETANVPDTPRLPTPVATVMLLIDQTLVTGGGSASTILSSQQMALTYGKMLTEPPVLEKAIAQLSLSESSSELAKKIDVKPVVGTQLILLNVRDEDASKAILLANTIAQVFVDQIRDQLTEPYSERLTNLQSQLDSVPLLIEDTQNEIKIRTAAKIQAEAELARLEKLMTELRTDFRISQQDYEQLRLTAAQAADILTISEHARLPEKPEQRLFLYITLAIIVGILLGTGLAFLLEYFNDTIRKPEDVSRLLGLETIGLIFRLKRKEDRLIVVAQPRSPMAEAFRILATNIRFTSLDKPLRTLLVTSPLPTEGKSVVVVNLAAAVAQTEKTVIAIDADLRLPSMHHLFKVKQGDGLTNSLLEGCVDGNLQNVGVEGLQFLPCGNPPPNPAEAVGSVRMRNLLNELSTKADLVLIDCPPVLPMADTLNLASAVDGVLIVLRAGKTRAKMAREALESLHKVGARVIGVVLNDVPRRRKGYYYHYDKKFSRNGGQKGASRLRDIEQSVSNVTQPTPDAK